jgi:hypothetical protein
MKKLCRIYSLTENMAQVYVECGFKRVNKDKI